MVPTLAGRIQTRLALLAVVGGLVTAIIVRCCRRRAAGCRLSERLRDPGRRRRGGHRLECLYHLLMQWRWEKDWPTLFGLVTSCRRDC